jgi:hypothetical protein
MTKMSKILKETIFFETIVVKQSKQSLSKIRKNCNVKCVNMYEYIERMYKILLLWISFSLLLALSFESSHSLLSPLFSHGQ